MSGDKTLFEIKTLKKNAKKDVRRNYLPGVIVCFILAIFFGEYSLSSYALTAYTQYNNENISYVRTIGTNIGKMSNSDYIKALFSDEEFWEIDNGEAYSTSPLMVFLRLTDKNVVAIYEKYGVKSPYGVEEINDAKLSTSELIRLNKEVTKALEKDNPALYTALSITANLVSIQNSYTLQFAAGLKNLFNMSNALYGIIILMTAVIGVLFSCFVGNPLKIGRCRFFEESASYSGTRSTRLIFLYRQGYFFKPALIMALRSVLLVLWTVTIVGLPIAYYRYKMIPYILAENPCVGVKDAFRLSSALIKKNKFRAFRMDLSFIGWHCLSIITLGAVGIFFTNSYTSAANAELYLALRKKALADGIPGSELLCDKYLDARDLSAEDKINLYYDNERAKARREEQKLQDVAKRELKAVEIEKEREEKLAAMRYDIDLKKIPQAIKGIPGAITDIPKTIKDIKTSLDQDKPKDVKNNDKSTSDNSEDSGED